MNPVLAGLGMLGAALAALSRAWYIVTMDYGVLYGPLSSKADALLHVGASRSVRTIGGLYKPILDGEESRYYVGTRAAFEADGWELDFDDR